MSQINSTNMTGKINNTVRLTEEIRLLQMKAGAIESKLEKNFDYLQRHYSSMIMSSFIGPSTTKGGIIGAIAGIVMGNDKLQGAVSNIVNLFADKASAGLEKLSERLGNRAAE